MANRTAQVERDQFWDNMRAELDSIREGALRCTEYTPEAGLSKLKAIVKTLSARVDALEGKSGA